MGKLKRERVKFHDVVTVKCDVKESKLTASLENAKESSKLPLAEPNALAVKFPDNVFAGISIDMKKVQKKLPAPVAMEVQEPSKAGVGIDRKDITTKFKHEKQMPKKDKMKLKRDLLMKKFNVIGEARKAVKERKKQQKQLKLKKQNIASSLKPLEDALPSLNELLKINPSDLKIGMGLKTQQKSKLNSTDKTGEPKKKKKLSRHCKIIKKKNEYNKKLDLLYKLTEDKKFRENPREMIAAHLKNRLMNQT